MTHPTTSAVDALRRIAEATPNSTNSGTAKQMASWTQSVARTALAALEQGDGHASDCAVMFEAIAEDVRFELDRRDFPKAANDMPLINGIVSAAFKRFREHAPIPAPGAWTEETHRDIAGETVMGMRVAAWTWEEPSGFSAPSSEFIDRYASHWSTGPKHAERLFRESDVRKLIASLNATPPRPKFEREGITELRALLAEHDSLPRKHDGLPVIAGYDDGALVCLSSYSGGCHCEGAWSNLTLAFYKADGSRDGFRSYRATDLASLSTPQAQGHGAGAGWKLVPREPVRQQLEAMHNGPLGAGDHTMDAKSEQWLIEMYQAAYDASQEKKEEK